MLKYPKLNEIPTSRDILDKFKGYNHNLRIGDGEFYDMKNLTGDDYPVLSPRKKRATFLTPTDPNGMCSNTQLCYVDGRDFHMISDEGKDTVYDLQLMGGAKNLISMGSYVVVMPDEKYINTVDTSDNGKLRADTYTLPKNAGELKATTKVQFLDVGFSNTTYSFFTIQDLRDGQNIYIGGRPSSPVNGDWTVYKDTGAVYRYSLDKWVEKEDPYYVGLYFEQDDEDYYNNIIATIKEKCGDAPQSYLHGNRLIYYHEIKVRGLGNKVDEQVRVRIVTDAEGNPETTFSDYSQSIFGPPTVRRGLVLMFINTTEMGANEWLFSQVSGTFKAPQIDTPLTICAPYNAQSELPMLDYIVESGNRLWGCRYGPNNEAKFVNEIYASVLGDFKDWYTMDGISTDAWIGSVGTSGKFTGAINFGGYPIFFKEDCMHRVYGDYVPYSVQMIPCKGVQEGCHKSLAIVNDVLYYKSRTGICAYDGSLPVEITTNFGDKQYYNAVGGAIGNKYYVSMKDEAGQWSLFVYDTIKRMWHKEDDTEATQFCNHRGELYYIDHADHFIHTVKGTKGVQETNPIKWSAETGILGATTPDNKYVTRLDLRMNVAKGSKLSVHIEYDSMGGWERLMEIEGLTLNTFTIPVIPHRCDHFRLKFEGEGDAKVFSISKTLEDAE